MSATTHPRPFSISQLNSSYLQALNKHPLLTKSITQALLNALNEQIASYLAGDIQSTQITVGSLKLKLAHTLTARVPLMSLYGLALNAPFAHYAYGLLNKVYRPPLTPKKKVAQILTSMATITPIISSLTIIYISFISSTSLAQILKAYKEGGITGLKQEFRRILSSVMTSLKNTLFPVIRSSWVSSPLFMAIAQKYLTPNLWVVFFSFCYFVLGTYNNTQIKKARKKSQSESQNEVKTVPEIDEEEVVYRESEILEATEITSGESTDVDEEKKAAFPEI